jgi:7,8-dihydroneopterin aldolase/epimerase/oxygenase
MLVSARRVHRTIVHGLGLISSIGVYDEERLAPQPISVDLELTVLSPDDPMAEDLAQVVDYAALTGRVRDLVGSRHFDLVETMAEALAALCLEDERVISARVRIEKPNAIADAAGVGVELERAREP